jgi:molybdopterin molybdotransferase
MLEPITEKTVEEVLECFLKENSTLELQSEIINVEESLSRILYDDIYVKLDQPAGDKALIDGYAVIAKDVAQADADHPISLKVIGESDTGILNAFSITSGEAVKISKGALMPINADAVIMPEDTLTKGDIVKIYSSAVSGFQVAKKGDDLKEGEVFILKQRKIRPQDIGGIIGAGYRQIKVFKKPVATIIPTGSELVPIDIEPEATQIIASNSYMLQAFVEQLGGVGKITGIVNDDLKLVKKAILKALEVSDMIIVSGGSALGSKDYTLKAIEEIEGSKIIAHSVAMKPGGHVLLAIVNGKPVIGLPGHPVSSMTCFNVFVKPVLRKLCGDPRSFWQITKDTPSLKAILSKKIVSPEGKDDFVRVRLKELGDGRVSAYPFTGRSSFLSTLVRSHGIIQLPADCTALYEGDVVDVLLF